MTSNQTPERDSVLFAFHEACARPTAKEIIEWTEKYPQFADDIRVHAAISRDWATREAQHQERPDESTLASAYSRALSALYDAEGAVASDVASSRTLRDILAACGKDVPSLQVEIGGTIGIARSVLADLFNGAMLAPLSNRLASSVQGALSLTTVQFQAALERTLAAPRFGYANASATPTVQPRSCEEIIRSSGMTAPQISYWLDDS